MNWLDWIYLTLAVIAVVRIWDCVIILRNIQRLLFDEQARRNKKEENSAIWGAEDTRR